MFSSKFLLALLVLLCATSSFSETKRGAAKRQGKKRKKRSIKRWRVKGTDVGPDASGFCYPGTFYNKKGTEELGTFLDCVTGIPEDLPGGRSRFPVLTTFTPNDEDEPTVQISCEVTVTPTDDLPDPFVARERCRNISDGAVLQPEGAKNGSVRMAGKVDNRAFPLLTFDLLWTIKYREP